MRIGELFAGYGGLGLAIQQVLGGEVAWVSEIDPGASAVLAARLPNVPNLGDVKAIDWPTVARYGPVDVLCGGFPCQDLSAAGARAGMVEGNRSGLWFEFVRAIAALKPKLVVIENVPGLLTGRTADSEDVERVGPRGGVRVERTHRAMGRVLRDLADLGFDAEWGVFSAADVGGCHLRKRVFIVGVPADADGTLAEVWGRLGEGRQAGEWGGRFDHGGAAGDLLPTPMARIGDEHHRGASHPDRRRELSAKRGLGLDEVAVHLLPTPDAAVSNNGEDPANWLARREKQKARGVNGNGMGVPLAMAVQLLPSPAARDAKGRLDGQREGGPDLASAVLLPIPRATDGTNGGPNARGSSGDLMLSSSVQPEHWGKYAAAVARWQEVFGRPVPEPTIPGQRGGRRLNPVFEEWMMGLPEGWVTSTPGLSPNAMLKALGNGVVPQSAALALATMLPHLL